MKLFLCSFLFFIIFIKNKKFNNLSYWTKDESTFWVFCIETTLRKTFFLFEVFKVNQIMAKQGFDLERIQSQ